MLQTSTSERSLAVLALHPCWWAVLAVEWVWHRGLWLICAILAKKLLKRNSAGGYGACAGFIGQSIPLPPSPSHYIIVCVTLPDLQAVLRSCWYKALAKFWNSYRRGHSAVCEQSRRALQGHIACFGVINKLLLLWEKSFLCAVVVASTSSTCLQKSQDLLRYGQYLLRRKRNGETETALASTNHHVSFRRNIPHSGMQT